MKPRDEGLPWLSEPQRRQLQQRLRELQQASGWSGTLPVALLERCWLRLRCTTIGELACRLPPDASAEAPELTRYRELVSRGTSPWTAQLRCWEEFGASSFQAALQRFWQCRDEPSGGWTLERYGELVLTYRRTMESAAPRRLPLIVLARPASGETHQLLWLDPTGLPMRHTCA